MFFLLIQNKQLKDWTEKFDFVSQYYDLAWHSAVDVGRRPGSHNMIMWLVNDGHFSTPQSYAASYINARVEFSVW